MGVRASVLRRRNCQPFRIPVGLNVTLRCRKRRVAREFLNVFERSAYGHDSTRHLRYERAATSVAARAGETERRIEAMKAHGDGVRGHLLAIGGADHGAAA